MKDPRQKMIVLQNSMMHAVNIIKHNSEGERIDLADVLAAADIIAEHVMESADK